MSTLAIIEDDDALRAELVEEMRFRGHEVHEARDGAEGFRLINEISPDIVLSDIDMPVESGFDLMKRLRFQKGRFDETTFIFVSGKTLSDDVVKGLEAGADDYIVKPIDYECLASKIDAVARKKARLFNTWSVSSFKMGAREHLMLSALALGSACYGLYGLFLLFGVIKAHVA